MAALTIQDLTVAGVTVALAAASAGGDTIAPTDDRMLILHVNNASGGSLNVIVDDPTSTSPSGATAFNPDTTYAVAAGARMLFLLDPRRFKNAGTGLIAITYSGVTTLTVGVHRVP